MTLDLLARTRLEKAAVDNGFELDHGSDGSWLAYASSHADMRIWLTVDAAAAAGGGLGDAGSVSGHGLADVGAAGGGLGGAGAPAGLGDAGSAAGLGRAGSAAGAGLGTGSAAGPGPGDAGSGAGPGLGTAGSAAASGPGDAGSAAGRGLGAAGSTAGPGPGDAGVAAGPGLGAAGCAAGAGLGAGPGLDDASATAGSGLGNGAVGEAGVAAFVMAMSSRGVCDALADLGAGFGGALPDGAVAARAVADLPALHHLVRRAFQLARALPDGPLKTFVERTDGLPRATEVERLTVQRIGQDIFRDRLLDYWDGRCAVTGLDVPELLRASHIKPWADCASDMERLDVFNGLLLAPHLDAAFDRGFISMEDDGTVLISPALSPPARRLLALEGRLRLRAVHPAHAKYLAWHRARVFRQVPLLCNPTGAPGLAGEAPRG